ncbi:MerR family transcriptional regulator [Allonocardiopsis opalescens]|uniref:DNA-binding transcriptional MerR regulator n=1 Tax=Allonocardiopsis opalescens TaxID=1144618 RepID=A0A2T0Q0J6_9ACTN|nr:MerR family transcriptional regulator [Allonocardiopsis opalescens]PRX97310.1 DNA-binding transcriptional MerR regulator [Allonocardiopsis opalescens]
MDHSVGEVAAFAGVTVRTLHHYDRIGLLRPTGRSGAGYRRYGECDLERLQQILFYRELGFSLDDIGTILDDPSTDSAAHLRRQHRLLNERIGRLRGMVAAVERALEAMTMGNALTPQERFELFGDYLADDYAKEAEERWGGTAEWDESQRKTAAYTKDDWRRLKAEGADVERRLAEAMRDGAEPSSTRAMDLAEEHRSHITRWFYTCDTAIHRGLTAMYAEDPRFRAYYDGAAPGLAEYVRDAAAANADRVEAAEG